MDTTLGPILGALVLRVLEEVARHFVGGAGYQVVYGAVIILFIVALPESLVGGLSQLLRKRARSPASVPQAGQHRDQPVRHKLHGFLRWSEGHQRSDADDPQRHDYRLIGPNGSGKSTFCNMVSGQIPPNAGRILLDSNSVIGLRADQSVAAGLARTYQVPRVPKELTIGEVGVPLRYVRSDRELPRKMSTAADVARFCGLGLPLDTACAELSISDLRRLEIARALACRPRVLLLDEAMAGLSVADTEQVISLVQKCMRSASPSW